MNGTLDLKDILVNMNPVLKEEEYVFCSFPSLSSEASHHLNPISTFQVHTSLDAVGLTSLLSTALAGKGISANVVAAYYHDHIFVPSEKAEVALETIKALKC